MRTIENLNKSKFMKIDNNHKIDDGYNSDGKQFVHCLVRKK